MLVCEKQKQVAGPLSDKQIRQFIRDGFVRMDGAFSRELADAGRDILWRDLPCDADDPSTWTQPVIWLEQYGDVPFAKAITGPVLCAAVDQLVGKNHWRPRTTLGRFPVRFPHSEDTIPVWHIDVSFPIESNDWEQSDRDYSSWRANIFSRNRAMLTLFLFSDVEECDAPTRIKIGSHRHIARFLEPAGEAGMTNEMLGECLAMELPEALAVGKAGTVYLCHPFLVHSAQAHRGSEPRFMAQTTLCSDEPFRLDRADGSYSPAEIAIREALREGPPHRRA